jgi:DNA-binding transcriptional LysR family regulator
VSVAGDANFAPRLGPEGSDHTDLINLVAAGEGIMLEAQFLFEEAMARLRSASLAARVVARRVWVCPCSN